MLQRIQTIYLMIVTMLAALSCALPVANFYGDLWQLQLSAWQLQLVPGEQAVALTAHFWGLLAISVLIPVVSFATIWFYRKRMLQIRLCILNILFMLGYYAVLGVCIWQVTDKFGVSFVPQLAAVFPLVNIILTWLALRGIGRDEAKVRAADRLR